MAQSKMAPEPTGLAVTETPVNGDRALTDHIGDAQVFADPAEHAAGDEFVPGRFEGSLASEQVVDKLRLLWSRRRLLGRIAGCGFLAATLIAFLISNRYTSTTRLMPPDDQSGSGLTSLVTTLSASTGGIGAMTSNLLGLKSSSDIFVGILNSRTTQDKLIQQFSLMKVYGDRRIEDARSDLEQHTSISVDRKSQIIAIAVTDKDPRRAAAMGQAYVESLDALVAQLSTSEARRERIFLEGRLQNVRQDLEAAEKDFSQFASKNTAIDIKEQGKAMVDAAATLQGELIATQSELQGLKQIYTENNVHVRALMARAAELQQQLDKLGGKGESSTSDAADESSGSMYPSIRKLPLLGVPYADLYRQMAVQEAIFENLTKEYELAKVQEAKEIPTVKVLDAPDVPDTKSFPPRLQIIFLGTAASCLFGMAWVFASARWEETNPKDPRKMFALEVVATVRPRVPRWVSRNGSGHIPSNGSEPNPSREA